MSELIKRKDGSYSRRGLWDNIRANKGSGKKPTKEMLAQERKIKNMQDGGKLSYEEWKKKYNLKETDDYKLKRAWELGYVPDAKGHLPTIDNQTLDFLKSGSHPTIKKELEWYNSPEGAEFKKKYQIDSTKQFWKYRPIVNNMQDGGLLSKLNPKNWGVEDYSKEKDFSSAYSSAKKAGESEFMYKGKRYNTKYAGTPRQEAGQYLTKNPDKPFQVNVFSPLSNRYLPGHIEAKSPYTVTKYRDLSEASNGNKSVLYRFEQNPETVVNYGPSGNRITGLTNESDKKSYYVYGADDKRFDEKAFSLPLGKYAIEVGEVPTDKSDWDLFSNNCADNVCDAFGIPRRKGLETPSSALNKIKSKYPTIEVTGRTKEDYSNLADKLLTSFPKDVLPKAKQIIGLASSPDLQGAISKRMIESIQQNLYLSGYDLPKSTIPRYKDSVFKRFDGILGKETVDALTDWQKKNIKMENGGSIPERYRNMGFSRVGQKKASTNEGKKWMVLAKKGDQYKVVHGGYKGMQDFKQHGSEQRKENFWNRMGGRDSSKATDPFSPLYWHKRLGTWEEGGRLPQYEDGGWFQKLLENLNPFTWFEDAPETYSQAFAKARSKGLDKFTWNNKEYTTALKQETAKPKVVKPVVKVEEKKLVSSNEFPSDLLLRQAHKESGGFRPDVISGKTLSSANAKGLAQIRPIALDEYYRLSKQPVGSIDLTNPEDNVKVQKFLMNEHYNSGPATKGNPTEEVRRAKSLAFFNKGRAGVIDVLNKAKEEGHDIYKSLSWIDKLPIETSDYIRKILLRTIPEHEKRFHRDTTNSPYNKLYGFKIGGQLPKLQDGNKVPSKKATYDSESDTYDLGSLNAVTVTGKAPRDSFGRKLTPEQLAFNQRIHNAQGQALSNLMRFTASGPQQLMMYGLTGKAQYPSEAIGYKNPEGFWQNAGNIGIDILTDPLGGPATVKGLYNLGKAATKGFAKSAESGLLSKTYKINPWAFKPNPEAFYHRSPNLKNIINQEKGILQGFGESEAGRLFTENALTKRGMNLQKGANSRLYFAKGTPLDWGRTNMILDKKTGKMIPGQGYPGPYIAEVKGVPMGVSTKGRAPGAEPTRIGDYAVSKRPISIDEAKFYKEDWLRGYKPVEVPGRPSGSSNVDELVDLWRIQERGARPMSDLAAQGNLGPMFQNEKAIQHFKDREKYFGQWFTKDKADFDFYKADREFVDPEIIHLQVPKSRLKEFQNYDKSLSRAADREFVIPLEQQKRFTPKQGVSQLPEQKHGGVITDSRGQWAHPGKVTRIPSNTITMQGVDTPLLGISDKGEQKVMMPNQNYKFANAKYVTEYPLKEKGGIMNKLGDTSNNRRNLLKQGVAANLYPLPFAKGGKMYKQGGIFIKPENRGKFTAWAKSKGMGVQEAASQVMANKEEYSPTIVKRANFAKNAAGWNKADGGDFDLPKPGNDTNLSRRERREARHGHSPGVIRSANKIAREEMNRPWLERQLMRPQSQFTKALNLIDPTGISGWNPLYRDYKARIREGDSPLMAGVGSFLQKGFSALPIVGKGAWKSLIKNPTEMLQIPQTGLGLGIDTNKSSFVGLGVNPIAAGINGITQFGDIGIKGTLAGIGAVSDGVADNEFGLFKRERNVPWHLVRQGRRDIREQRRNNENNFNKAQGGRMAMNYNLGNMNIEPKSYAQGGGIDNPGFKSLPDFVQAKIKANMEAGGVMRYRMGGKTKFNKMC